MRDMRTLMTAIAGIAVSIAGADVSAQTVRGIVASNDIPVPGVVVQLVDTASRVVARSLSNERGEFRVTASAGGIFRVRTLRIGYAPTMSAVIALRSGEEVARRIALSNILIALDTIRVTDRSSCRGFGDGSASTFTVWDQVRTALTAAQLTASTRAMAATTVSYERSLDAGGRRVTSQSMNVSSDYVKQPWRTIAPERLRQGGYVVIDRDNSTTYYAPGIDMLLSSGFVEDHCFRLISSNDRLGVEFEPTADRKNVSDIKGTIWLDRRSSELRSLEYRYANIDPDQAGEARGDMEFARLRNGAWVITKWSIRMPVLENRIASRSFGGNGIRVTGIQVSGGELSFVRRGSDTLWSRPGLAMNGDVVDSATSAPSPRAGVALGGTSLATTADARGRFTIPNVLPGEYTAEVRTASLDSVNAIYQTPVMFADASSRVELRVPNASQLTASVCRGQSVDDAGVVLGNVSVQGDTMLSPRVSVSAEWSEIALQNDAGNIRATPNKRRTETRPDANGVFRICGVPVNTPVSLRASADGSFGAPVTVRVPQGGRFARAALTVDRSVPSYASLSGLVVVDSTKQPIPGTEVSIAGISKTVMTNASGAFKLDRIPPGEYTISARHIGYTPLEAKLVFAPGEIAERQLVLAKAVTLDSVVVNATATDLRLRDFEDNKKLGLGHFLTRDQLEKQSGITMGALMSQFTGVKIINSQYSQYLTASRWKSRCSPLDHACLDREHLYWMGKPAVACYALVYLDNALMNRSRPTEPFDLRTVYQSQMQSIEYYEGSATTPSKYNTPGSECGVLVIHTRMGG
jgi:hypothetical protein